MDKTKSINSKSSHNCLTKKKCQLPSRYLSDERNFQNIQLLKVSFVESVDKHFANVPMMSRKNEFVNLFHNYFGIDKNYYRGTLSYDKEVFRMVSKYLSMCSSVSNCFQITSRCPYCKYTMEVRELYLHMNIFHNICSEALLSVCPFCLDNKSELYIDKKLNIEHLVPCSMVFNLDDSPFHDPVSIEWFRLFGLVIRKTRRYFNKPNSNCTPLTISNYTSQPKLHDLTLEDVLTFDFRHMWQNDQLHLFHKKKYPFDNNSLEMAGIKNTETTTTTTNFTTKVPRKIVKRRNTIYYENRLSSFDTDIQSPIEQENDENGDNCNNTINTTAQNSFINGNINNPSLRRSLRCSRRTFSNSQMYNQAYSDNELMEEGSSRKCKIAKMSMLEERDNTEPIHKTPESRQHSLRDISIPEKSINYNDDNDLSTFINMEYEAVHPKQGTCLCAFFIYT